MTERAVTPGMRRLLYVAAALVFLAGVQLFVFPERTDRWFAWTIGEPLTAAVLGAAYWSAVGFEVLAARQARWADARIAVPAVFAFTLLTFVVTLVHLEVFHLGAEHGAGTRAVTWAWLTIYAVVPPLMLVVLAVQQRAPGADGPRGPSIPTPLAGVVAVQAAVLLPLGALLLLAPARMIDRWPWALTPLTARALGAWAVGLGIAAAHALVEREQRRLRPAAAAFLAFGVLEAVALARYADRVDWSHPGAVAIVAFLASAVAVGAVTLWSGRSGRLRPS